MFGNGDVLMMEIMRVVLKIIMWILIVGFGCNFIMQTISYSFYKNAKKMPDVSYEPQFIQITDELTGYGYNLNNNSDKVILFFGGSNYIAYNSVGKFAGNFDYPFVAVDYYGTQASKGKMNLKSMKRASTELYDWTKEQYPNAEIVVMGHSYGTGMATYLASVRDCQKLILAAGYRDISDLYNKMVPIFWGPLKVFISNNICAEEYAKEVKNSVYVIGSTSDKTLGVTLQEKLSMCFSDSNLKVFDGINHEDYFVNQDVIRYIDNIIE